jgi:pimeloyl-ACP methyl ester carboxylesterase
LVEDIRRFLDSSGIDKAILVGHSFAGLEMPHFAIRYPGRAEALIYLDALFPRLEREPDLSGDPVWSLIPTGGPTARDLVSRNAYLAFCRRARPAWDHIWSPAIEAELMNRVTIREDGRLMDHHDNELINSIYVGNWPNRDPDYGRVEAPMLAIVPDGGFHQAVPHVASEALRRGADRFWRARLLPWLRARTEAFRQAAPDARVVELESPYHHIFIAEEDATVAAIEDFMG